MATKSYLILIFTLYSCAWSNDLFKDVDKDLSKSTNQEMEKMGVEKELLDKFTVDTTKEEEKQEKEKAEKEAQDAQAKSSEMPKMEEKLKIVKKVPPKVVPKKVISKKMNYPKDYPPEFISLSKETEPVWKKFVPNFVQGEMNILDIEYLGMTVGKIIITYAGLKKMDEKEVFHFTARFKSAPFYSALYELDDKVDTFVAKENFQSLRYNLVQRESKQDVDEIQLFDREALETKAFSNSTRDKGVTTKKKQYKGFIPYYSVDAFSVIFLLRGLPLNKGEIYKIPVVNKGKVLILNCTVEEYEEISIKSVKTKAIRLRAETAYTGHTLKSGEMIFWFSHDEKRELLRAKAKIKMGSVYAEKVVNN